jgi:hypothetical protein
MASNESLTSHGRTVVLFRTNFSVSIWALVAPIKDHHSGFFGSSVLGNAERHIARLCISQFEAMTDLLHIKGKSALTQVPMIALQS